MVFPTILQVIQYLSALTENVNQYTRAVSKKKKTLFVLKVLVPGGKIVLSVDKYTFSDLITVFHQL